ncbi:hypothetical protein QR680_012078 [Steinernema hermaphroditum]|uniref:Methyltransferase type 11 domain-containing protein n=1 Tax=Steinernema hermaphroditum TaxID=289476 RepID=A0AA39LZX2_9BILA|nr:hypothetical protein QR680_012078 [Steinernema hermaphroditum]
MDLENEYVHDVYRRLAAHCSNGAVGGDSHSSRANPKMWPNVRKFMERLPKGSVVLDVGCGHAKYSPQEGFVVGFDMCADVLCQCAKKPHFDGILADALRIPVRSSSVDAALCVSVLHHLSSVDRRKAAIEEIARCLRPRAQVMFYVWAFEQPNGQFSGQDLLVPWYLHELSKNGKPPLVRFHKDSTREQRIISNSIPVKVNNGRADGSFSPLNTVSLWIDNVFSKLWSPQKQAPKPPPPAVPTYIKKLQRTETIVSGIRQFSPALSRRLASLFCSVEEQLATELSEKIVNEAVTEALSTLQEVTFYRYYHVFRKGELEQLISAVPNLRIISSNYDNANWCVVTEKIPSSFTPVPCKIRI